MAREWGAGTATYTLYGTIRGTPAEREVTRHLYRMGLDVAQRWDETMSRS